MMFTTTTPATTILTAVHTGHWPTRCPTLLDQFRGIRDQHRANRTTRSPRTLPADVKAARAAAARQKLVDYRRKKFGVKF